MPREFWINIYEGNIIGWTKYERRPPNLPLDKIYAKVIYRLHVKLKDNYKCQ